jgi:endogenous inhibitor of DNA gyrase (YacG/DUF329 family)
MVEPNAPAYPFCCERCRTIDLGQWLSGRYAIAGRPDEDSERESPRPPLTAVVTPDDESPEGEARVNEARAKKPRGGRS